METMNFLNLTTKINMQQNIKIAVCLLLSCWFLKSTWAQDSTTIDNEEINIIKDFEPIIKYANKIGFPPDVPSIGSEEKIVDDYYIEVDPKEIEYEPSELKPKGLVTPAPDKVPLMYLKAGFGLYVTPLVDFELANRKREKFEASLGLKHISSYRKKVENQKYGETNIGANGTVYLEDLAISAFGDYDMNNYNFYGYDDEDTSFSSAASRHRYRIGSGGVKVFSTEENPLGLFYNGSLSMHHLKDSYDNKELGVFLNADVYKVFKDKFFVGGVGEIRNVALRDSVKHNRFTLGLHPYFNFKHDRFTLTAGFNWYLNAKNLYFFPNLAVQAEVARNFLVVYAEWTGDLKNNNLLTAQEKNPWLQNHQTFMDYGVETRTFIGFKGSAPIGLDYNTRFSQLVYTDMPLFLNDSTDFRKFNIVYDTKLKAWNYHLSLGYQFKDMLHFLVGFDYYKYNSESQALPWHLPSFNTNISASYQFNNKLILEADLFINGNAQSLNENKEVVKIKGGADLNFSASYHFNDNVAFFANLNNTLAYRRQSFYNYPGYGLQVLGGAIVSF